MSPIATPDTRFRLADHVRACRVDDQVILLDLRRTRYIGVGGPRLQALAAVIADWPVSSQAATGQVDATGLADSITPFLDQGMLVDAAATIQERSVLDEPVRSLNAEEEARHSRFEWRKLPRLWRASTIASSWLRRRSLHDIALTVASSRPQCRRSAAPDSPDVLRAAVADYLQLRPFAFTAHDRCLHDSLALVLFLAAQGMFPSWVIGVRTRPFGAHSWVQSADLVLNDLHENVRAYRPILVV
jgi:hypothetical protein